MNTPPTKGPPPVPPPVPPSMPPPLVTVMIPAYNMARFVPEALQSLIAQTHAEFQAVVVDDGSSDDIAGAMAPYLAGGPRFDPRMEFIRQDNQGKQAALSTALKAAKGEFVCILDPDDTMPPQGLELRVNALLQHPQAVAVFADANYMDISGRVYRTRHSRPFRHQWQLVASPVVPVIGASLMVRRWVYDDIGALDTSFVRSDDAWLNVEVYKRGPLLYLPKVVLNYRNYPRSGNLRLRLVSIYHDCRLIRRHYGGVTAWLLITLKAGAGLAKFAYELVTPKK